jgi:hypothetical protein
MTTFYQMLKDTEKDKYHKVIWDWTYIVENKPGVHRFAGKGKLRGVGYTRPDKDQSKRRRKMAKASRKINRGSR